MLCFCGECLITKKNIDTGKDSDYGPYDNNIKRAGSFIHSTASKVLLVQSYNGKWGPPKGKVEHNEFQIECAIRETMEETGIDITNKICNIQCEIFNNKWSMYNILLADICEINPQSDEITGYGWFSLKCVLRNKHQLNHPAKLCIRTFMNVKI